jgi:tetratricopeptide (TPR) repeat protein
MISLPHAEAEVAAGRGNKHLTEVPTARIPTELLTVENFPHVHLDHTLDIALKRMAESGWRVLPVVSRSNVRELQGIVTLNDILQTYGIGAAGERKRLTGAEETPPNRLLVPGVIASALALLMLIAFLNYYYRSQRAARAEQDYQSGIALERQQRESEAVESYRHALSASPGNVNYRLALGLALIKMGQLDEGAGYLRELLKRDPNNGAADLGLARIAAGRNQTADAVTYYHRAVDANWPKGEEQNRVQARLELAGYLAKHKQNTQAIAELLAAVGQVQDVEEKKKIGKLLLSYGSPRQSADVFREILRGNDQDAGAYAGLGAAQLAQDNYAGARSSFRSALRYDPGDETARKQLDLDERILALDPDARGIRSAERYRRSQTLLEGALKMFDQCTVALQSNTALAERAAKALTQHPRASASGDATEENLTVAADLWRSRQAACSSRVPSDEALARVLTRLSRQ